MKNYIEIRCHRDINFSWKFFLILNREVFVNFDDPAKPRDLEDSRRMSVQLNWQRNDESGSYNAESISCGENLRCCPDSKLVDLATGKLASHRIPSIATLPVQTGDDEIYHPDLSTFEDKYGQVLNQRGSDVLISYLTVLYLHPSLVRAFVASNNKLQSKDLCLILDSGLFEPGKSFYVDFTPVG